MKPSLLVNGDFAVTRVPAPAPTVTSKAGGGLAAADGWTTWNNTAATTTTELLGGYANPAGDVHVMRVSTSAAGCGIVQAFLAPNHGPDRARSNVWVKLIRGAVTLGTGNSGNTHGDAFSRAIGDWQQLSAVNGVSPANELIVYATQPDTEFLVSHATCQELPLTSQLAPLAALDADGSPLVIGYEVPEPMSYTGRNYIEIALPAEAFRPVDVTVASGSAAASGTAASGDSAGHVQAAEALHLPPGVVPASGDDKSAPVLAPTDRPMTARLRNLTGEQVTALAQAGQRVIVHPTIGNVLDYRIVDAPHPERAVTAGLTAATPRAAANATTRSGGGDRDPGPARTVRPWLAVFVDAPQDNAAFTGSASGVVVTVTGRFQLKGAGGVPAVNVMLDDHAPVAATVTTTGFTVNVPVSADGAHTLVVTASKVAYDSDGNEVDLASSVRRVINVTINSGDSGGPTTPPTVTITDPADGALFVSPEGQLSVTVSGTAAAASGLTPTQVTVSEGGHQRRAKPRADGKWSAQVPITGTGSHTVTAIATDSAGQSSPPAARTVTVSHQQPFRRLLSRLMLVETLNLSSFLGPFGAGRVIKTFSLLPGESTTISVNSYTKTDTEQKQASSIVDSTATESADDFTDSLNAEQSSAESQAETQNYKIGAKVGANWGWGSAEISGEYSGSANATRQEAVKNLTNATRHHSLKASTNRSVTVNTEYQVQQHTGVEESTQRTISNINVSRTLNFVFRGMNQQHVTLIHLTNVRIAFYVEDLILDADGNPQSQKNPDGTDKTDPLTGAALLDIRPHYQEVPLPQLQALLDDTITGDYQPHVQTAILNALSGIPDYQDRLQTAYEWVEPTKADGTPVPQARYMQFPRALRTQFVDPISDFTVSVPGIVLDYDHITMRTEGVLVESVLGPGDGLDSYAQQLQQLAVNERQAALEARRAETAREHLAQQIVANKDDAMAALWAKVFPPPPAAIVAAPPSASGTPVNQSQGDGAGGVSRAGNSG